MSTLQFIKGDLQSGDLLNYILRRENVDTVLHFAAQVGFLACYLIIQLCLLCVPGKITVPAPLLFILLLLSQLYCPFVDACG